MGICPNNVKRYYNAKVINALNIYTSTQVHTDRRSTIEN